MGLQPSTQRRPVMHLKVLLNRVHPIKGLVYKNTRLVDDAAQPNAVRMEVGVRARCGSRGVCSKCGRRGSGYDHLAERRFEFVPLWGIAVVMLYAMRRIDCR